MKIPFRQYHLLQLFKEYDAAHLPLDVVLHHYFKSHKALGSKDRHFLANTAMNLVRWQGLLDAACGKSDWASRFEKYEALQDHLEDGDWSQYPAHVQVSFPKELYQLLSDQYGAEGAREICLTSNRPAPVFIRANTLKISRDELLERLLNKGHAVRPTVKSPDGVVFDRKVSFSQLEEYKDGLFDVQDEGSQLLSFLVEAKPGDQVLDFCAGSGGKTLGFAPRMKEKGQIYLHDIRPKILQEAKKRMKRAGIQNFQIAPLEKLKKKMDWVLVDAPCSGTGTIRRNPDMKWRFSPDLLKDMHSKQRVIFEQALSFVKPGGHIVYGTCSLLKQENDEQLKHFLDTYPVELIHEPYQSLPKDGEMDGFYGVVLKNQTS